MNKTKKKIPKTFVGFLIASFLIWLLITLSKEYITTVNYSVKFSNLPQNKILEEEPIKNLDIVIKATGFKIISSKFSKQKITLNAFGLQNNTSSKYYFLSKNQTLNIQKQLLSGVKIQNVVKDTIFLKLGVLVSKKVALKPQLKLQYHIGYDLVNNIKLEPDSVLISGPKQHLKKIDYLLLSELELLDIKNNFKKTVNVILPKNTNKLKLNTTKVSVIGKVEQFTEGKLNIPFTITNLPKNKKLTSLSKTVEIVYVVALSNFADVSENSFKIECDFEISNKNNLNYLIPKIVEKPNFIKSFKILPTKIDFLIQK